MKKAVSIITLLILFTSIGNAQSDKIKIYSDDLKASNYLQMDDFYLTHYLYIDLFLRENLFPEASPKDVSYVLGAIKKYVSPEHPLNIEIVKPDDKNYKIKVSILKKEDGTELLIAFTNWSTKKRLFEDDIKIKNDSYTRWYFLNGDKMTYRKDMSDQNDYSIMSKSDLANAYLLDEIRENDSEIEDTLREILKVEGLNVSDAIMANLILLKYQIFQRNTESADRQVEYLNDLFDANASQKNLRGLKMAFNATKFQIELMK